MTGHILWNGRAIAFWPGETIGTALLRAGVRDLGQTRTGQSRALFCGIGQCQGCLVRVAGRVSEACLTPCRDGVPVQPDCGAGHD